MSEALRLAAKAAKNNLYCARCDSVPCKCAPNKPAETPTPEEKIALVFAGRPTRETNALAAKWSAKGGARNSGDASPETKEVYDLAFSLETRLADALARVAELEKTLRKALVPLEADAVSFSMHRQLVAYINGVLSGPPPNEEQAK